MIAWFGKIFRSIILIFATTFKRALCFLNRKRRNSGSILPTHVSGDSSIPTQVLPMNAEISAPPPEIKEHVHAQQDLYVPDEGGGGGEGGDTFVDWDSWDNVTSASAHSNPIAVQNSVHPSGRSAVDTTPAEPPPEPDYFSDLGLAPTIKKQKKVFVKPSQESSYPNSDRLSFKPDAAIPMSSELGDWEDVGDGWEGDDLYIDPDDIKQTRRAELERRRAEHQRRNQEKEARRQLKDTSSIATRLS